MDKGCKFKTKILGFTLVEFIIVLVLLGILAASVNILWPGRIINLAAQASLLADDIRYTQSLAMTKGERYRLVQISADRYQIANSSGAVVTFPLRDNPTVLGQGIGFTSPIGTVVVFDSRGIPYSDTNVPGTALADPLSFVLSSEGRSKTVTVFPETGRVFTP